MDFVSGFRSEMSLLCDFVTVLDEFSFSYSLFTPSVWYLASMLRFRMSGKELRVVENLI